MGKKGGKKSSAAAAKTPKCTCEHLFKCACGNRPERPSRGHKWDPETQQWGGKGHKQKGGSGQTSQVSSAAKVTAVGKTEISEWQKLPSNLLDTFCRKEKRPNPKFKKLDRCARGKYKYRVIIQDAKVTKRGGDHDMFFVPAAEVSNEEQAKEESALLALLHLTPTLPHERTLPEPYKTTWLNAIASMKEEKKAKRKAALSQDKNGTSNKTSSNGNNASSNNGNNNSNSNGNKNNEIIDKKPAATIKSTTKKAPSGASASSNLFTSNGYTSFAEKKKQKEEKKKQRSAKIRKHENFRMANKDAQVFMSAQIRKQIESFLRGDADEELMKALALEGDGSDEGLDNDDDDDDDDDIVKSYVVERLSHEGFSKSQAKTSYIATLKNPSPALQNARSDEDQFMDKVYEECLQWLCVHLNEDQLPEGFDPRGRTLDVLLPAKKSSKNDTKEKVTVPKEVKDLAQTYGLSIPEATLLSASSNNNSLDTRSLLWKALLAAADMNDDTDDNNNLSSEEIEFNEQIVKDEIEVLQSMFVMDEDFTMKSDGKMVELCINLPSMDDPESVEKMKVLHILYEQGRYPHVYPQVFVTGNWKEGSGTSTHINLTKFLSTLSKDEPMVFELYGEVQQLLDGNDTVEPVTESMLIPHLEGGKEYLANNAPKQSTKKTNTKADKSSLFQKKTASIHRRPRQKSFFWSKKPKQTPSATAFPKISTLMDNTRKRLPAAKARSEFLSVMKKAEENNGVILVTGETGCGKTTQIPQFILEEAPNEAKIVIAQPRRLAATGVADRVAKERGEEKAGVGSVGYVVRGDVAMCNNTRLMFCTTGVLLRQLQSEGALDCITHIVIDEVHERHLDTDVLLGILKESRPPHLRVVLMSATMDADRFAGFWGPSTPRMHIPGFTHPVRDFMLEDVLSITGYVPPKNGKKKSHFGYKGHKKKQSPWADSEHSDNENDNEDPVVVEKGPSKYSASNPRPLPMPAEELVKRVGNDVDYDIIAILVRNLIERKDANDDGSILVFLPGAPEIAKAQETILKLTKGASMTLLPLHGGLQPKEQQRVFQKSNYGTTKVILSTNVAETSITIPDCTMVIDTCKEKQSSYDPSNRMPMLIETFSSQDSLRQRRGRAGRVRPGSCYKLISKEKFEKLSEHGEPEIKRCALDQTLLSLVYLGIEQSAGTFLSTLLDPPSQTAIDAAIYSLEKLGAINFSPQDRALTLTPLGMHLAAIPAPPCVGKMLVMGSMLGCRSAALALAAGMSVGRSPFIRINSFRNNRQDSDEQADKQEAKNQLILQERKTLFESVGNSDLALLAATYMKWDEIKGGGGEKRRACEYLGLSFNGMRDMKQMVKQLDGSLRGAGFADSYESDKNANSWRIIRSCIVSSLAPAQFVRVQRSSTKYTETVEGAVRKDGDAKELKFYTRSDKNAKEGDGNGHTTTHYHGVPEERVFIHPSSANFSVGDYSCPWIVYHQLVRTSKPFLRDANECNIYDLLLFGGNLEVSSSEGVIVIDNYARLSANARIGALIGGLRRKVDEILAQKVANPSLNVAKSVEMKLIVKLLRTDGMGI